MNELKAGIYQHYKGPLYLVLGLAHDSNADTVGDRSEVTSGGGAAALSSRVVPFEERIVVVYVALNIDKSGPPMAVRTLDNFLAWVCTEKDHRHYGEEPEDFEVCGAVRRFAYIGTDRPSPLNTEKSVDIPVCSLCHRARTLGDPLHPMDSYDYTPMQAMTGQPFGWYSGDDGEVCPECMRKTVGQ